MARNHEVRVITGPATEYHKRTTAPKNEVRNGVSVLRCWGTAFDKNQMLGRLINAVTRFFSILISTLLAARRGDVIFVVTNPPVLPIVAYIVSLIRGASFVVIVHDVYPEVLVVTGLIAKNSLVRRGMDLVNRVIYRTAQSIVTIGRDMTSLLAKKLGKSAAPMICIPNWGDSNLVSGDSALSDSEKNELKLNGKFVVLWIGNMGRTHAVEDFGHSIKVLGSKVPLHYLVIGSGAKYNWFSDYIRSEGFTNVSLLPPQSRERLRKLVEVSDVAVILFIPGMSGLSVPSRMYDLMAAGKAIIAMADPESELALVINENRIGWVVPPGDHEGLAAAIKEATSNPARCRAMGQIAKGVVNDRYLLEHAILGYEKLVAELGLKKIGSN